MSMIRPGEWDADPDTYEVIWQPTPKQAIFLECDDFEVLYGGAAGGGKALCVLTPIPTPSGWVKMIDLRPGDVIFDDQGAPCTVLADSGVMIGRPCYKLTFSDGSQIVADADHLWPTMTAADRAAALRRTDAFRSARRASRPARGTGKRPDLSAMNTARQGQELAAPTPQARTTAQIAATLRIGKTQRANHSIAVAGALRLPDAPLLVEPYALGLWLGDGTSASGGFTTADPELADALTAAGYQARKTKCKYRYGTRGLAKHLDAIGVLGHKHIPDQYLRASAAQRLALLQGLMDTDGTATDNGSCELTLTNLDLAIGALELILSLGIKATIQTGEAKLNGRIIGAKYRIKFLTELPMFRLARKLERQKRDGFRGTHDTRYIESVEPVPSRPVKCIKVSSPSRCFLAGRSMIPTHNSDALLIDALCLQHGGIDNPNHRAILFRRSFPELRDLIGRSLEIYKDLDPGAVYNSTEKIWTFTSGAKVEFGYLQNDNDRLKYRGRAWNYIGFDELTLWPTPTCYLYLFSRCRSTDKSLPRYIRATTNPDGPGQKWVMERWGIQEDGKATCIPVDIVDEELGTVTTVFRQFIPARLSENTHLTGTGYREALLQLAPEERDALLLGLWKQGRTRGAYYANEMQKLRAEGRIRHVPYTSGLPVNTFWDLGWNDTTAIWFMQQVAGETRFIKAYENSGESLEHYAKYLISTGYNLSGTHYLPHDAANKSLQTGKSAVQILQELMPGLRFEIVPRVQEVLTGINQTRLALGGNVYFDADECGDGLAAMDQYRKKYNARLDAFTDEPEHDRYSNYADALRQWGQSVDFLHPKNHSASKRPRRTSGLTA